MLALLASWILKPKNLLILLVMTAVLSGFIWYGSYREKAGYGAGTRSQLEVDKTQFEQVSKQYQDALSKAQSTIDSSNTKLAALDTQLQTIQMQFAALATQRTQGQQSVNKLPDSAVQGDLEVKLGGTLTDPAILRKDDQIVTDYPLVLKQIDVLNTKVDGLDSKVDELGVKEKAVEQQRDSAIQFGNQIVPLYIKAYNAAQIHHSKLAKILSLGLVRDKHLDLPSPASLNVPKA